MNFDDFKKLVDDTEAERQAKLNETELNKELLRNDPRTGSKEMYEKYKVTLLDNGKEWLAKAPKWSKPGELDMQEEPGPFALIGYADFKMQGFGVDTVVMPNDFYGLPEDQKELLCAQIGYDWAINMERTMFFVGFGFSAKMNVLSARDAEAALRDGIDAVEMDKIPGTTESYVLYGHDVLNRWKPMLMRADRPSTEFVDPYLEGSSIMPVAGAVMPKFIDCFIRGQVKAYAKKHGLEDKLPLRR